MAFGELNMTVEELYNMTPRNFINAQMGKRRLYEQDNQAAWERARWMACVIINPHLKRPVDPKKITTFPWEKVEKTAKSVKRDIERIMKESDFDDKVQQKIKKKDA